MAGIGKSFAYHTSYESSVSDTAHLEPLGPEPSPDDDFNFCSIAKAVLGSRFKLGLVLTILGGHTPGLLSHDKQVGYYRLPSDIGYYGSNVDFEHLHKSSYDLAG